MRDLACFCMYVVQAECEILRAQKWEDDAKSLVSLQDRVYVSTLSTMHMEHFQMYCICMPSFCMPCSNCLMIVISVNMSIVI